MSTPGFLKAQHSGLLQKSFVFLDGGEAAFHKIAQ
jgi:hypothetical protein